MCIRDSMISACEQSSCNHLPSISYFNGLGESLDAAKRYDGFEGVFVLDTIANQSIKDDEILNLDAISIVTGPESGFSATERKIMNELELRSLKAGHYILRAETAPIVGLTMFHNLAGEY